MPFHWVGAIVSTAFLAIVVVIFGLLLKVGDCAATEVRESILPGLVVGFRAWAGDDGRAPRATSPRTVEGGPSLEEMPSSGGIRLEHVRRAR